MCFTYEVLETFCNLPILAANPKNCLHRTPHFPMTSQRAHPTAPYLRHPMTQRRVHSKHHTCTTPQRRARAFPHHCTRPLHDAGYASSHHAVPAPIRNTAPVPLHGAVRVSTQGAVLAPHHAAKPHAAHSTALGASPPLGTAPKLPEVWKQKSDQNCNFFAIGNCRRCPNHESNPENEAKRPLSASFPLYRRRERAANRKNVAKAPGFLFS